jgi:hypothetical protein
MVRQREGRSTRYYCTPTGVDALKQFGIELLRPEERKSKSRTSGGTEPRERAAVSGRKPSARGR